MLNKINYLTKTKGILEDGTNFGKILGDWYKIGQKS